MKYYAVLLLWFYSTLFGYGQDGFTEEPPRLAYWQVGQNKETVIVLHGGPGAPHQYLRPEFDALSKTARVIYYDQRGCGKSDTSSSYIWQGHVNDLNRLVHTLAKDQKVFLAGSSWGSVLAILYTYTHPEDIKGLILSGTVPWYGDEGVYERNYAPPTKIQKLTIIEKRLITQPITGGRTKTDTVKITKEFEAYLGLPQYEAMMSRITAPKAERLTQIQVPILLFNGTYDRRLDWVDEYVKLFPNVKVYTLSEAGHDAWLSNPDLFFSISNEFIKNNSK
ncbi:alpha/beta fold hydrolase [Spirosoma flavum]|uniref:Alpha/beta fold hydrolase n=1 Tax=Spirosoma flavum TaxID=2048557 RepID=A0ABW6APF6_9BACT